MAKSTNDLAKEYVSQLIESKNKYATIKAIADNINSLTYVSTGEYISQSDKLEIAQKMKETYLIEKQAFSEQYYVSSQDNEDYLELVDTLIQTLREK